MYDGYGLWTTVDIGSGVQYIASTAFKPSAINSDFNTITTITINRPDMPADLVANSPFGASLADVSWS